MRGSQFRFESESRPSRCRSRLEGDYVQSIDLNHNVVFNDYGAILWPAWPIRPFWPPFDVPFGGFCPLLPVLAALSCTQI
jgi:hypothetical protein